MVFLKTDGSTELIGSGKTVSQDFGSFLLYNNYLDSNNNANIKVVASDDYGNSDDLTFSVAVTIE